MMKPMELNLDNLNVGVPLRRDADGEIYIGKSRVLLETVIWEYKTASTPEKIVEEFETLKLEEVYAVISYYLLHQEEIDAYIMDGDREVLRILKAENNLVKQRTLIDRLKGLFHMSKY